LSTTSDLDSAAILEKFPCHQLLLLELLKCIERFQIIQIRKKSNYLELLNEKTMMSSGHNTIAIYYVSKMKSTFM